MPAPRHIAAALCLLVVPGVIALTDTSHAASARCTVVGTPRNDVLVGTGRADRICGYGGNDVLRGLGGNDVLLGGDGNDTLYPGKGSNTVNGNAGTDTLRYDDLATGSVVVDLLNHTTTRAVTDTLGTIENVFGTYRSDRIYGNNLANKLVGRAGDDLVVGAGGDDEILGFDGDDRIKPGAGNDSADGGTGTDLLSYEDVDTGRYGVSVDLAEGLVTGQGRAGSDTAIGFEDLFGTRFGDRLKGTNGPNVINAAQGRDTIFPRLGDDYVQGGGFPFPRDGDPYGDIVDYSDVTTTGVTVDLVLGTASGPGDTILVGIINAVGTNQDDTLRAQGDLAGGELRGLAGDDDLIASSTCNLLYGGDGDDLLKPTWNGGCGDEAQWVAGGPGLDTVTYSQASAGIEVEADFQGWSVAPGDTLVREAEILRGSTWDDVLHGGLGQAEVTFYGGGGADDMDTTDGFGGDTMIQDGSGSGTTCVGDASDVIDC